jgi:Protein of unknown function (DUF1570)
LIPVRALKVLAILVPFAIIIIVLRGLGESCRERGLPDGYGAIARSDRWCVYGPVGDSALAQAGENLDAFRRRFHETYAESLNLRDGGDFLSLYVFRRLDEFREFARARLTDDTNRITGFYWPGSWSIAAVVPAGMGLETFRHECVHAILDRDAKGGKHAWSPWIGEGLAQAFERPRPAGGRLLPGLPHPMQAHLVIQTFRDGKLPPVLDLMFLSHDQFMAQADLNYAYAAALVLFLMEERWSEFRALYELERAPGRVSPGALALRIDTDLRPAMVAWLEARVR